MPPDYVTSTASSSDETRSHKQKCNTQTIKKPTNDVIERKESKSYIIKQKDYTGIIEKTGKIVTITTTNFLPDFVTIFEGESITFQLHPDAEPLINNKIIQIDKFDNSYKPVHGGFNSAQILQTTQTWSQEFNTANEYYFQFASHKPLKVNVRPKPIAEIQVTDEGFTKPHFKIFKGDAVRWFWNDTIIPITVTEIMYCVKHGGYKVKESRDNLTKNGVFSKTFMVSGIFYFLTELGNSEKSICVIQALERRREHLVMLSDEGFSRAIFDVLKGERVWIKWDLGSKNNQGINNQDSNESHHKIQIKNILINSENIDQVIVGEDKKEPSSTGLFSYVFDKIGVYEITDKYYLDDRCTVVVKAKANQHVVRINKNEFTPGNVQTHNRYINFLDYQMFTTFSVRASYLIMIKGYV